MRLLGLFQMWNVIRSFFPYLELCDEPWGGVLQEFIPRFIEAGDAVRYWRAAAAAYTRTQDSHCMVSGAAQAEHLGTHVPGIALREIEGVSVVIQVAEGVTDVVVGDVLLTVDGEPVAQRAARLGALLPASTPQAHAWKIQQFLLRGAADTQVRLRVSREDGGWSRVELPRDRPHMLFERQGPLFQVLPEGIGYIDTVRLPVSGVTEAMEAVAGCPALILDLRGYPRGTAWQVAAHLTTDQPVAARFRRSDPATPEARARSLTEFEQLTLPPAHSDRRYDGRIAVLIDESAISHAEHSCLFLKASRPDLVFIGSATNGANGDVTSMSLPGGLRATFSGQGVWWPDGTQLQRSGVQPDVEVRPTLAGVRAGRDEVLEAAVAALGAG
jgi:C-terminal processing protease CtpA/Prc